MVIYVEIRLVFFTDLNMESSIVNCMSLRASKDWDTDASVAAFTVASTRALIAAGSMAVVEAVEGGSKNASSLGVGDGDGVRFARLRMRVWGDGYQ